MNNKKERILYGVQQDYKKKCKFCGHTISFYAFEPDKKLCSFCKRYNYKDEMARFKDELKKKGLHYDRRKKRNTIEKTKTSN